MTTKLDVSNIYETIKSGKEDSLVGISIGKLTGNEDFALYATEIAPYKSVGAHYHTKGNEIYQIIEGDAVMNIGKVGLENQVEWNNPVVVKKGDCFTVLEGQVHQLKNTSDKKLIIVFGCPNTHLTDDRYIVQGIEK